MRLFIFFTLVVLVGCGGGGGNGSQENKSSSGSIAGLWNMSLIRDQGLLDISYMRIGNSGDVTYYNYLGDDYDKAYSDWGDCYFIQRERTPVYTHLGGNDYKIAYPYSQSWSFDSFSDNLTDKTYDVRKGEEKLGTLIDIKYSEIYLSAYINEKGELVGTSDGTTDIRQPANKTIEELENYTRCPYSD